MTRLEGVRGANTAYEVEEKCGRKDQPAENYQDNHHQDTPERTAILAAWAFAFDRLGDLDVLDGKRLRSRCIRIWSLVRASLRQVVGASVWRLRGRIVKRGKLRFVGVWLQRVRFGIDEIEHNRIGRRNRSSGGTAKDRPWHFPFFVAHRL